VDLLQQKDQHIIQLIIERKINPFTYSYISARFD